MVQLSLHNCSKDVRKELCNFGSMITYYAEMDNKVDKNSWPFFVKVIHSVLGRVTIAKVLV